MQTIEEKRFIIEKAIEHKFQVWIEYQKASGEQSTATPTPIRWHEWDDRKFYVCFSDSPDEYTYRLDRILEVELLLAEETHTVQSLSEREQLAASEPFYQDAPRQFTKKTSLKTPEPITRFRTVSSTIEWKQLLEY